ncbi:MAG: ABC transporter permease [Actinobacteria bacterium]|nr:ABC transporter permease [Actinomycetota bacterium]
MTDIKSQNVVAAQKMGGDNRYKSNNVELRKLFFDYSGLIPFFLFAAIFIGLPTGSVIVNAFRGNSNEWTFENLRVAFGDIYFTSLTGSIQLGFTSALTGAVTGLAISYGVAISGKKKLQRVVATASGVFANTGGVPLAFFFIAAIGNYGLVTIALQKIGIDIYSGNFTLFGFSGLVLVYLYFQIPLMVIVTYPAIEGIKNEWREAAVNLGATKSMYWRYIGIPILTPAFTGAFLLLFANAFAAYATANVLTSGTIPLLPIQIGSLVNGNVVADQTNVGMAMGLEMIIVVAVTMGGYIYLDRKTSRWRKR